MPTIHLQAQVSPDDLLQAAEQLGAAELEQFASRVLTLLAHRRVPSLSPDETTLLQAINQGIPSPLRERYQTLRARRDEGTLTPDEHAELVRLSDEIEAIDVRRFEQLDKLARLRGVSLEEVMDSLGIRAPEYE